ncbi:unnamed protein product, partial [marine sediment metagenome]
WTRGGGVFDGEQVLTGTTLAPRQVLKSENPLQVLATWKRNRATELAGILTAGMKDRSETDDGT